MTEQPEAAAAHDRVAPVVPGRTGRLAFLLGRLERLNDSLMTEVAAEHDVQIHLHGGISRPPKPIDEKAEKLFGAVRDCCEGLGLHYGRKDTGGVCDGNNIAATGVPVVDTMGVRGGAIHSPQEFMIVSSLCHRLSPRL